MAIFWPATVAKRPVGWGLSIRAAIRTWTAAGSPNFTVSTLPAFFAPATSVLVETQSATNFDGVAGASSLAIGDTVSLSGLLFSSGTPATPDLIAKKVRKR